MAAFYLSRPIKNCICAGLALSLNSSKWSSQRLPVHAMREAGGDERAVAISNCRHHDRHAFLCLPKQKKDRQTAAAECGGLGDPLKRKQL
jgi:hypothetical protein